MKVGDIGETVEVRMETPLLETRNGTQSVNVSGDLLRSVPLTERREWYGALAVVPGVVTSEPPGLKFISPQPPPPPPPPLQPAAPPAPAPPRPARTYLRRTLATPDAIHTQT